MDGEEEEWPTNQVPAPGPVRISALPPLRPPLATPVASARSSVTVPPVTDDEFEVDFGEGPARNRVRGAPPAGGKTRPCS